MNLIEAEFYLYEEAFDNSLFFFDDDDIQNLTIQNPKMVWAKGKFDLDRYICHWHNSEGDIVMSLEGSVVLTIKLSSKVLNEINKANEGSGSRTGEE